VRVKELRRKIRRGNMLFISGLILGSILGILLMAFMMVGDDEE
jgi:uncharacterized oligopeptide transporter (OPT) family protein